MSATTAVPARDSDAWPADAGAIQAARTFLQQTRHGTAVLACDSDVDGLASAVLLSRAVEGLGGTPHVLAARRGEHVHAPAMRARIAAVNPGFLVVADMGSRPAAILPDLPTLIVDHHDASGGLPPGAVVVNGYDRPPAADLVAWLRSLPFTPPPGAEFAHGHARATGGSLPHREFEALLRVLGFTASVSRGREQAGSWRRGTWRD